MQMEEVIRILIKEYGYDAVVQKVKLHGKSQDNNTDIPKDVCEDKNDNVVKDIQPSNEPRVYKIKTREEVKKERQDHLIAIRRKYDELFEKGISPRSLLTKENMEKWLKSGMSYQRIAREEVGLSELEVSRMAKEYGLISVVGQIIRRKHAGY